MQMEIKYFLFAHICDTLAQKVVSKRMANNWTVPEHMQRKLLLNCWYFFRLHKYGDTELVCWTASSREFVSGIASCVSVQVESCSDSRTIQLDVSSVFFFLSNFGMAINSSHTHTHRPAKNPVDSLVVDRQLVECYLFAAVAVRSFTRTRTVSHARFKYLFDLNHTISHKCALLIQWQKQLT